VAGGKQTYQSGSYAGGSYTGGTNRASFTVQLPDGRRERSGDDRRRN
jgi:hypothetical protein